MHNNAIEARITTTMKKGEVGALGTTDEAAMGYYLVEWLSEPYSLQIDTDGMTGVIGAGKWWWMQCILTGWRGLLVGIQNQRKRQLSRRDLF